MKPLRECPVCGRTVSENRDGRLRAHDARGEGSLPRGMRSWCEGTGAYATLPEQPLQPRLASIGKPIYYHQTDEGWTYSFLIPTGGRPTHLLLEHDQAQALIDVARNARLAAARPTSENMRGLRVVLAHLGETLGQTTTEADE